MRGKYGVPSVPGQFMSLPIDIFAAERAISRAGLTRRHCTFRNDPLSGCHFGFAEAIPVPLECRLRSCHTCTLRVTIGFLTRRSKGFFRLFERPKADSITFEMLAIK